MEQRNEALRANGHRRQQGFALIILAVALAIAGSIIIALLSSSPTTELRATISTQNKKIKAIHDALIVYYNTNSSTLPCPASRTLAMTSASFAKDYAVADGSSCSATCTTGSAVSAGVAGAGVMCSSATNTVKIGTVPTRSLSLPDDYGFDDWGHRILYAVDTASGGTAIRLNYSNNSTGVPVTNIDGTSGTAGQVSAVIISHGKDGDGSYTKAANAPFSVTCASAPSPENENCNDDSTFIMDNKVVSAGATTYDDITSYIAAPSGCNNTTNMCEAGIKLSSSYAMYVFRFNKNGSFKVLQGLGASTTPKSPWSVAFPGGTARQFPVRCKYLPVNGNTGCVITGDFGDLLAVKIDPNSGITTDGSGNAIYASTTLSAASTYSYVDCDRVSTSAMFCMATVDYTSVNPPPYDIFRVDFSGATPVITKLTSGTLTTNNNWIGPACAKAKDRVAGPTLNLADLYYTSGGALGATTYYVKTTYSFAYGESLVSGEQSIAVPASQYLKVARPSTFPSGATGWNVYVGTTAGAEKRQNGSIIGSGADWTQSGSLATAVAMPASIDEALCVISSLVSNPGYHALYRIENITSGGPVGGSNPIIVSKSTYYNRITAELYQYQADSNAMNNTPNPMNFVCKGITGGRVLCAEMSPINATYTNGGTTTFGIQRWTSPFVSGTGGSGYFGNTDFRLIDSAYYNGAKPGYQSGSINGCTESVNTPDNFLCTFNYNKGLGVEATNRHSDTFFEIFGMRDCNTAGGTGAVDPGPVAFAAGYFTSPTYDANSCFFSTGIKANLAGIANARVLNTSDQSYNVASYLSPTTVTGSNGMIVTCSAGNSQGNSFCMVQYASVNGNSEFSLWKMTEGTPSISSSTFTGSSLTSGVSCDLTGSQPCATTHTPYYDWPVGLAYSNALLTGGGINVGN
jgi:type II secretory pathway pseudopilin PulG